MSTIIRSAFSDTFLEDQLPALEGRILESYEEYPEQYSQWMNVDSMERDILQHTAVSGLGLLSDVVENGPVTYDQPVQAFDKTYKPVQRAGGFIVSRVAFDDDKYGWIRGLASDLGRSARETVEIKAALVLNNAFTDTGPDGKVLFATDHPNVKSGGTQANRATNHADLSVPALEAALTMVRKWTDHAGRLSRFTPDMLMVPPDGEFIASRILSGNLRSGTADNDINAFRKRVGMPMFDNIMVNEYLTDTDSWFVFCRKSQHKINFFWREKFNLMHDVDFNTRGLKTAGWMRFDVGYSDWRGVWGSAGA